MAATPRFKVHNPDGKYIASCKHLEDAAALVALYGDGARILDGRTCCWSEGQELQPAEESFDFVAEVGWRRIFESARRGSTGSSVFEEARRIAEGAPQREVNRG